jgi:hypothetical protein
MARKKDPDAPATRLIADDEQDKALETLARKQARLVSEITERKGALEEVAERITVHLKTRPKRAYINGPFKLYIEAKDKLHVEVEDETGETA